MSEGERTPEEMLIVSAFKYAASVIAIKYSENEKSIFETILRSWEGQNDSPAVAAIQDRPMGVLGTHRSPDASENHGHKDEGGES